MPPILGSEHLPLESLYRWEHERPRGIFLTQPHGGGKVREWTWSDTALEVRRMAAHLKAQGWPEGSRVGILGKNSAWWIMADLAIWMAGHVSVPIYASLQPVSTRRILEHSECRGCFLGQTDNPDVQRLGAPANVYRISMPGAAAPGRAEWEQVARTVAPIAGNPVRSGEEVATIIYTSGTTGQPKGVVHRFGALAQCSLILRNKVRAASADRFISYLPLAHIVERCGLELTAVLAGARVFFSEGIDTFLDDLKRARPTIFLSVPRLFVKFQQAVFQKISKEKLENRLSLPIVNYIVRRKVLEALGLNSVRLAASGAAPLPPEVLLWYRRLGLPLVEGYGMTETMITHLPEVRRARPGCVGAALEGIETRISDDRELLIRSPMNMLGYYKDPESTRAVFDSDGYFHTGDLVSIDPDGQVRIVGRAKDQFKTSKGKYVAPAPIESRLAEHAAVESCCLMGAGLPSPFALVLLNAESRKGMADAAARRDLEQSFDRALSTLNDELDPHERVAFLVIVDGPWTVENGLITPTLKIRRNSLEAQYGARVDAWRTANRRVIWDSGTPASVSQVS